MLSRRKGPLEFAVRVCPSTCRGTRSSTRPCGRNGPRLRASASAGTSWVKPVVPEEAEEAARKGGNGKLRQQAAPAASSSLAAASLWRNAAPINIVVQL